jgi:hypothetical protein
MEKKSESIEVRDLIQLAGSLIMGTTLFLGLNYWLGDRIIAVSISAGIVVCALVYGLVYLLVKAKKAVSDRNRAKTAEILALSAYVLVAIVSGIFTLHYLTVEMNKKGEIKIVAENSLKEIRTVADAFKMQEKRWSDNLVTRLKNAARENDAVILKKYNLTRESTDDDIIKTVGLILPDKIKTLNGKLRTTIDAEALSFMDKGLTAVKQWSYFSIMNTMTHIDETKKSYLDDLVELSKQIPDEIKDMTFTPPVTVTVSDKLSELETIDFANGVYGLWFIVLIITNVMALFPYLFSEREGNNPFDKKVRIDKKYIKT